MECSWHHYQRPYVRAGTTATATSTASHSCQYWPRSLLYNKIKPWPSVLSTSMFAVNHQPSRSGTIPVNCNSGCALCGPPDIKAMQCQAVSESLRVRSAHSSGHLQLLQAVRQRLLSSQGMYTPTTVGSDGNCFFCSVSFTLFSNEHLHVLLHLMCGFKCSLYAAANNDFYPLLKWMCGLNCWITSDLLICFITGTHQYLLGHISCFSCQFCHTGGHTNMTWPVKPGELSPFMK